MSHCLEKYKLSQHSWSDLAFTWLLPVRNTGTICGVFPSHPHHFLVREESRHWMSEHSWTTVLKWERGNNGKLGWGRSQDCQAYQDGAHSAVACKTSVLKETDPSEGNSGRTKHLSLLALSLQVAPGKFYFLPLSILEIFEPNLHKGPWKKT